MRIIPKQDRSVKPLLDIIGFANTPEGEAAKRAMDELVRRGTPADIPLAVVQDAPLPEFLRGAFEQSGARSLPVESRPDPALPGLLARVVFWHDDGTQHAIEAVRFRAVRQGTEAVTLSNKGQLQAVPLDISLALFVDYGELEAHLHGKYPENAYLLRGMLRLQAFLSEPFGVDIYDLTTGLRAFHVPQTEVEVADPDPDYSALIEALATVQLRANRVIVLPDRDWTDEEENTVVKLVEIVHHGGFLSEWEGYVLEAPATEDGIAEIAAFLDSLKDGKTWLHIEEDQDVEELFETSIPRAPVRTSLNVRADNEPKILAACALPPSPKRQPIQVRLIPGDGNLALLHYTEWAESMDVERPEWMK